MTVVRARPARVSSISRDVVSRYYYYYYYYYRRYRYYCYYFYYYRYCLLRFISFFWRNKKVRRLKISFIFFRFSSLLRGVGGGGKNAVVFETSRYLFTTVFIFRGGVFIVRANRSRSIVEHDDSDWFFRARITIDRGVEVELGSVGRGDGNHRGSI